MVRRQSSESHIDESEMDAIDALCSRLSHRQIVHRVSDRELMHGISEITRNIALLDDPSGQFRAVRPRLYTFNCSKCHLVGDSELRNLGILEPPVRSPSSFPLIYAFPCWSVRMELTVMRPAGYWREFGNQSTTQIEMHYLSWRCDDDSRCVDGTAHLGPSQTSRTKRRYN